ncbi:MAG TPA: hypothetical protein ENI81_05145 [Phycisphaerales bacterium]|nr:hypothetical protein [Phycisphaerales bacterium]
MPNIWRIKYYTILSATLPLPAGQDTLRCRKLEGTEEMEVAETIESVRSLVAAARKRGDKVGLVQTMGALHVGQM